MRQDQTLMSESLLASIEFHVILAHGHVIQNHKDPRGGGTSMVVIPKRQDPPDLEITKSLSVSS